MQRRHAEIIGKLKKQTQLFGARNVFFYMGHFFIFLLPKLRSPVFSRQVTMLKTELAIFRERAEHAEELVAQLRPLAEERGRIAEELDLEKKRFRDISDDLMLKVRYRYLLVLSRSE